MKKAILGLIAGVLLAACSMAPALAGPHSIVFTQKNAADTGNVLRTPQQPAANAIVFFNTSTNLPDYLTIGPGLIASSGVLSAAAQANADWNATDGAARILNRPHLSTVAITGQAGDLSGLAQVAVTGAWADISGKPALFSGAWADLVGKPALAPVATTGSYNDLSDKPAALTPYTFDFGLPVARTVAVSTAYQAINAARAAEVSVSAQCTASLNLAGGSTCTLQARVGAAPLTCSNGAIVATWSNGNTGTLTVGLGLQQTVGAPYSLKLPIGASFILCPVAGTFTITAAEQTAG